MKYIAVVHKEKNSDFGVLFPDFPGCISGGSTPEEAKIMAAEALEGHIDLMREQGEILPSPSSFEDVLSHPEFKNGLAFYVDVPCKSIVRCNVSFREDVLQLIDRRAYRFGLTRSAFLSEAALRYKDSKKKGATLDK